MAKECKHAQWRLLDKRHSVGEKTVYIFHCIRCLKLRRITFEDNKW